MPDELPKTHADYSHFAVFNAAVDGGRLQQLKEIELKVWLVYLRHADADGVSFPGPTRIARAIGHGKINHVCTARLRLEAVGLLTRVPGGAGVRIRYRVSVPLQSSLGTSPDLGLVPNRDYHKSRSGTTCSPKSGLEVVPNWDSEQHIEHPNEQHREQPSAPEGGDGSRLSATPPPAQQPSTTPPPAARKAPAAPKALVTKLAAEDVPELLRTPGLVEALSGWVKHRAAGRAKLTRPALEEQIKKLAKLGPERAEAAVRHSLAQGWQGIYEDKNVQRERTTHGNQLSGTNGVPARRNGELPRPTRPLPRFGVKTGS